LDTKSDIKNQTSSKRHQEKKLKREMRR